MRLDGWSVWFWCKTRSASFLERIGSLGPIRWSATLLGSIWAYRRGLALISSGATAVVVVGLLIAQNPVRNEPITTEDIPQSGLLGVDSGPIQKYTHSREVHEYISRLRITDPEFYNVFTEGEVYSLFAPNSNVSIPFYIWDDLPGFVQFQQNCDPLPDNASFLDGDESWYEEVRSSPWRVYEKSKALVHYLPVDWGKIKQGIGASEKFRCSIDWDLADETASQVVNSPEWKRYEGANFFYISSTWRNEGRTVELEHQWLKRGPAPIRPYEQMLFKITAHFHSANVHLRTCTSNVAYSPSRDFRDLTHWPAGPLESYRYPKGIWAQVQEQRKYNSIFIGQGDNRRAYTCRRRVMEQLPGVWEPSVLAWSRPLNDASQFRKHPSETHYSRRYCLDETDISGCTLTPELREKVTYGQLMLKSKFGFHFRGDDFSSARFADIVAAQAIPIVVMKEARDISTTLQCYVPWDRIAYFVDLQDFMDDSREVLMREVLNTTTPELEKRFRLLQFYRFEMLHGLRSYDAPHNSLRDYVQDCLPEGLLREFGLSKASLGCKFQNFMKKQVWNTQGDEDDEPAWTPHWIDALVEPDIQ